MLSLQETESQGLPSLMPATAKSVVLRVTRAKPVTYAVAAIKESIDTTQKLICDEGGGTNTNATPW